MAADAAAGGHGQRLLSAARSYLSTELINAVATVAGVAVFTRLVPPSVYGSYAVAIAAGGVAIALTGEWLQAATLRLASELRRNAHRDAYQRALLQLTAASTGVLLVATLAALALLPTIAARVLALWAFFYAALSVFFLGVTTLFQANLQSRQFALYRSAYSVLRIVLAVALVLAVRRSAGSLVGGSVFALALLLPGALRHLLRGSTAQSAPRVYAARAAVLRYGLPFVLWFGAGQVLNLSHRFFLQVFRGSAEVGIYAVSYAVAAAGTSTILQPILGAVVPLLVRAWGSGGPTAAAAQMAYAVRVFVLVSPLLFLGLTLFGPDALAVVAPHEYATGRVLISVLAAGVLLLNAGMYLQKALELHLRSRVLVVLYCSAAGVNILLNVLLIPRFAMMGAAVATLAGYACYAGAVYVLSRRALPYPLPLRAVRSALAGCAAFAFVAWTLERVGWLAGTWQRLVVAAPAAALAYGAVLVLRGELRPAALRQAVAR